MKLGFCMSLIEQSAKGEGGSSELSIEAEGIIGRLRFPCLVQPQASARG